MSMTLRAIIMIAELVSLIVAVLYYRKAYKKGKILKYDFVISGIGTLIWIILSIFIYPTRIFLSNKKLVTLSILSLLWLLILLVNMLIIRDKIKKCTIMFSIITYIIIITVSILLLNFKLDRFVVADVATKTKEIVPMVMWDKVAGFYEEKDGIRNYIFYEDELDPVVTPYRTKHVEVANTEKTKPYVIETITTTTYKNLETKKTSKDYIKKEVKKEYVFYLPTEFYLLKTN